MLAAGGTEKPKAPEPAGEALWGAPCGEAAPNGPPAGRAPKQCAYGTPNNGCTKGQHCHSGQCVCDCRAEPCNLPPCKAAPGGQCGGVITNGTRPGADYASVKMSPGNASAVGCQKICCADHKSPPPKHTQTHTHAHIHHALRQPHSKCA